MFRCLGLLVGLALLALPAPAWAVIAAGSNTFEFSDGSRRGVFGPNAQIILPHGTLRYSSQCAFSGSTAFSGENDFITAISDVYLVRAGSVANEGDKLVDAVQSGEDDGGGQNTIITLGNTFTDETIAFTEPGGNLVVGTYDLVFDTCQNAEFDPDDDTVFPFAVTVRLPPEIHGNPGAYTEIQNAKANAKLKADVIETAYKATKYGMDALELLEKYKHCRTGNLYVCLLGELAKEFVEDKAMQLAGVMKLKEFALNYWNNTGKAHRAIANDPPDPAFEQTTVVPAVPAAPSGSGSALDAALAPLAEALAREQAVADALLHATERYQGAQRAADADWALLHAREVRGLAASLAALAPRTRAAFDGLHDHLEGEGAIDAAPQALRDGARQMAGGLSAAQRRDLRNLGLSPGEMTQVEEAARAFTLDGQELPTRAGMIAVLAALDAPSPGVAQAYADLGASAAAVVADLEVQAAADSFVRQAPTAAPGGPYSAVEGTPLTLDGSGSSTPQGTLVARRWDLDLDGQFDDASGATPSVTFTRSGTTVIGLEVEASGGRRAVAYVPVQVAHADGAPAITAATPDAGVVTAPTGATRTFTVTAADPNGHAVTVRWRLDGTQVAQGTSFGYLPAAGAVGVHILEAVASDGRATGGETRRRWSVRVLRPDADADTWHANVDCNDANPNIHPVRAEIFGNGIDEDCDAGTADVPVGGVPGRVLAWGGNRFGELGTGESITGDPHDNRRAPVNVVGLTDVVDVAAGGGWLSVALRTDGSVWSWGANGNGQLGDPTAGNRSTPGRVTAIGAANAAQAPLLGGTQVAASSSISGYALRGDGTIAGWGREIGDGGDPGSGDRTTPLLVADVTGNGPLGNGTHGNVEQVVGSGVGGWAILEGGRVAWWGDRSMGCDSSPTNAQTDGWRPKIIESVGTGVVQVTGVSRAVFLKRDGEVLACNGGAPWVDGFPTGTGTPTGRYAAKRVTGLGPGSGVVQIAGGHNHTLALLQDGRVLSWGRDDGSQLGDPTSAEDRLVPTQVALPAGPKVVRIEAKQWASFAIRADGSVLAWGDNRSGELGVGSTADGIDTPTLVALPAGIAVRALSSNPAGQHTLAVAGSAPSAPPAPGISLSVADVQVAEGAGNAQLTVTRSHAAAMVTTFRYKTAPGTAKAGEDFTTRDAVGTIAAGATQTTVSVPLTGDLTDEDDEAFTVALSEPSANVRIADGSAAVVVADDDAAPAISVGDAASAVELDAGGRPALTFTVALQRASAKPITVRFDARDGTATLDEDVRSASGEVAFAAGQTSKQVALDVLGDLVPEPDETIELRLSQASGATIADASGQGLVRDDDPFVITTTDTRVVEGDSGRRALRFAVRLAPAPRAGEQVTVGAASLAGSAEAPADFAQHAETVGFGPGETTKDVTISVTGDVADEPDERLALRLSGAAATGTARAVRLARSAAAGLIADDDLAPAPPRKPDTPAAPQAPAAPLVTVPQVGAPFPRAPKLTAAQVIALPSARRCVSRRRLRITLRAPRGVVLASASLRIGRGKLRRVAGKKLTAPVDLRGLPRGRFTVEVVVRTRDGQTLRTKRQFRTCAPKAKRRRRG